MWSLRGRVNPTARECGGARRALLIGLSGFGFYAVLTAAATDASAETADASAAGQAGTASSTNAQAASSGTSLGHGSIPDTWEPVTGSSRPGLAPAPKVAVPEVTVPQVTVPEIAVPEIAVPEVTLPDAPHVTLTDLSQVTVRVAVPQATVPASQWGRDATATGLIDVRTAVRTTERQVEEISGPVPVPADGDPRQLGMTEDSPTTEIGAPGPPPTPAPPADAGETVDVGSAGEAAADISPHAVTPASYPAPVRPESSLAPVAGVATAGSSPWTHEDPAESDDVHWTIPGPVPGSPPPTGEASLPLSSVPSGQSTALQMPIAALTSYVGASPPEWMATALSTHAPALRDGVLAEPAFSPD
jgi:hypothetical protein